MLVAALGGAASAFAGTTPDAANSLASITPNDNAALSESPEQIVLAFNQELDRDDVPQIDLTCGGDEIDTGIGERDAENLFVTFAVFSEVPRGVCIVEWELTDALGATITDGRTTFRVDADPSGTTPAGDTAAAGATATTVAGDLIQVPADQGASATSSASDEGSSGGALWLGRFVSTLGVLVVFGALALISVGWPEGPEYIVTVRFLRTVWGLALAGTVLYLIALTADTTGRSFGGSISPTTARSCGSPRWRPVGRSLCGRNGSSIRPRRCGRGPSRAWR